MTANSTPGSDQAAWVSGWWRGRPYGSDDGTQIGFATLEVDLLGQPIARLWNWSRETLTDSLDGAVGVGLWDSQVWLRYDSIDGVVDHVLRTGDQTIVVSSTVPTAECAAILADAQTHQRDAMPPAFFAACFTALVVSSPDVALAAVTSDDAAEIAAARASAVDAPLPDKAWQAVDLVEYLEALVLAEADVLTRDDTLRLSEDQ